MKWYWAILQTIMILGVLLLMGPTEPAKASGYYFFIFALFAIWVAADSSSLGWGLFVFFVWPIGYPSYLIERRHTQQTPLPKMADQLIVDWLDKRPTVEEMFAKAVKLDQKGDWADALAIYDRIMEIREGEQEGEYARNCARDIRAKMKMATTV